MPADLNILSKVSGEEAITRLKIQLEGLLNVEYDMTQAKQVAIQQNKIEMETIVRQNAVLKGRAALSNNAITMFAQEKNIQEDLIHQEQHRMQVTQLALYYKEMYYNEGIQLSTEEARVVAENNMAIIESEKQKEIAVAQTMRTMRYTAQAFFMTSMAMNKMLQSLKPLVKDNEQLSELLDNMTVSMNLLMAPMQAVMGLQMLMTATSLSLGHALAYCGAGFGAMLLMMMAIQTKSAGMRAVLSALTAVVLTLALAHFAAATATMANAAAFATLRTVMGDPTALLGLGLGIAAAIFAVGTIANMQKGQVLTGHSKKVRKGGLAILDDDERITREHKGGTRGGGGDIVINLPESYNGSMADAKITANKVRRYVGAGYGDIKYKRKVVTG